MQRQAVFYQGKEKFDSLSVAEEETWKTQINRVVGEKLHKQFSHKSLLKRMHTQGCGPWSKATDGRCS